MSNKTLFFWSLTVAMAGLLFGFDTVVISGADLALQDLWDRGELFHGVVIMSSALWGTVVGALFGSVPSDRFGRKPTLLFIGVLYTLSAVGCAIAADPWSFAAFRFLGGLGVGASTVAAPAYISEIAPANSRGRLVALYQFNIVLGILVAFLSNFFIDAVIDSPDAWRWMLGVEAFPAAIYTLLVLSVPESPRWLAIQSGKTEKAFSILKSIMPAGDAEAELGGILARRGDENAGRMSIWQPRFRRPLILAFLIAMFNQFSGINAFLYYAPRIFESAGLDSGSALLSSVGIGLTNLVFTLVGMSLIDRFGRRQLMFIGSAGYIVSLSMVSMAFFLGWKGLTVPGFFFLFIASHAIGQGTVIWVFISEIFPTQLRASGQAFGSSTHWVLAAAIPSMVPVLFSSIGPATVFACFAGMMVLQLLFVFRMMPETKAIPLEVLGDSISKHNK
jgi:sugar porter (SP) family MFS transporter